MLKMFQKILKRHLLFVPIFILTYQADCQIHNHTLWYNHPAANWNEALPLGNGSLGAMAFGGISNEHLQLNESTLYSGEPSQNYKGVKITGDFDKVMQLLRDGKNGDADEIGGSGTFFETKVCARHKDGELTAGNGSLHLRNSSEVVFISILLIPANR